MKLDSPIFYRRWAAIGSLAFCVWLGLNGLAARAEDATAPVTTNSITGTNSDEADKAWKEVNRASQAPMPPAEWAEKQPSSEEISKYYLKSLLKGADLAKDFYTRYPNHPKASAAQQTEYDLLMIASQRFGDTNQVARLQALETKRANDPNASEDTKLQMRMAAMQKLMHGLPETLPQLQQEALALQKDFPQRQEVYPIMLMVLSRSEGDAAESFAKEISNSQAPEEIKNKAKMLLRLAPVKKLMEGLPGTKDALEASLQTFQKDFPDSTDVYNLMVSVLMQSEGDKARAIATEIAATSAPDQVKEMAKGVLKRLDSVGKPVDIQFTAVDGRPVDLSKMNGKVVLVDFWATWCGPCMAELPNVKAAYGKLHDKGFEIVGISFDEDKDALDKTLKQKEMTWPQFFDGAGWKNKYAQQYGIESIPTMWLVDKKGILRDVNARGPELETKVAKFLAEE